MRSLLLIMCLALATTSFGQDQLSQKKNDSVLSFAEQMPHAGYDYNAYVANNIIYPDGAAQKDVEGRVVVGFIIRKDGHLDSCIVKKGIGSGCDEEAVRVVRSMPPWVPGMQGGQPVDVAFALPITFKIDRTIPNSERDDALYNSDGHIAFAEPRPAYDLNNYFRTNGKYSVVGKQTPTQGIVYLNFVLTEDGDIDSAIIINGIDKACDDEALRLITNMPTWRPRMRAGIGTRASVDMAIRFRVRGDTLLITNAPGRIKKDAQPDYDVNTYLSDSSAGFQNQKSIDELLIVKFKVRADGSLDSIKMNENMHGSYVAQLADLLSHMPAWQPAMKYGRAIEQPCTLSIKIKDEGNSVTLKVDESRVYSFVESMPKAAYDVGDYLLRTLHYPEIARRSGRQGQVIVQFVVDPTGKIADCRVIKSVGMGCDEEAVRVVMAMPPWKPGKQAGKPVPVYFTLPISFKLK